MAQPSVHKAEVVHGRSHKLFGLSTEKGWFSQPSNRTGRNDINVWWPWDALWKRCIWHTVWSCARQITGCQKGMAFLYPLFFQRYHFEMGCWIDKCHRILQVYSNVKDASQHLTTVICFIFPPADSTVIKNFPVQCTKLWDAEID